MNVGVLRLGFAVFWLAIAALLFFRHELAPGAWGGRFDSRNLDVGALLAVALAVWNVVRWYMSRRRPTPAPTLDTRRRPLEPRRGTEHTEEYNPEFDFTKRDEERS